jgi:hypothetical protein
VGDVTKEFESCFPIIRLYMSGGASVDIAANPGVYENLVQALAHQFVVFSAEMAGSRCPVAIDLRVVNMVAHYRDINDYDRSQEHRVTMNEYAERYAPKKPPFE